MESLKGQIDQRAVGASLNAWHEEVKRACWESSADVKRHYRSASVVGSDRVVFNIKGNDYRLVTSIDYGRQIVFVKWLGSHSEYDEIDVATVAYER